MSADWSYAAAIREGYRHALANDPRVFVMGQGLWSPWYVGSSMTDLDKDFGRQRIIDTPVSELACTGAAIGAAQAGLRPIVVHPRMDFMVLAADPIVNQAAKWSYMLGGRGRVPVTIRAIVNRGGEQGAQHSQALHAWFCHVPGLRVVMPATPRDARDLLVAATQGDDPVLYIDDRWLYDVTEPWVELDPTPLPEVQPRCVRAGTDVTIVGASHSTRLAWLAAEILASQGIEAEVWDLRQVAPLEIGGIVRSVERTGRLVAVDGGWASCGLAAEVVAAVTERIRPSALRCAPLRLTLPPAPAPAARTLEAAYYPTPEGIAARVAARVGGESM
jgi:pyruvate dehydrogenase E1 component beta subunit